MRHQTYKHHTSTRQWAKVEPASHTSVLTVYQPRFYFLFFAVEPFFSRVITLVNRNGVQSLCGLRMGMKKNANERTDVWIHQQIRTCEMLTKLEELGHRRNTGRKSGLHVNMISTDNGFPSFLQTIEPLS